MKLPSSAWVLVGVLASVPTLNRPQERCRLGVTLNADSAIVESVATGSPAERAGMKRGDIIFAVEGVMVIGTPQVQQELAHFGCGDTVTLTLTNIMNAGAAQPLTHVQIVLEAGEASSAEPPPGTLETIAMEFQIPPSYPPLPGASRVARLDIHLAEEAKREAGGLRRKVREEFPRGFYLGRKEFEGEAGQKLGTTLLLGVQIGKAGLTFYLMTPYSEARYLLGDGLAHIVFQAKDAAACSHAHVVGIS